MKTKSPWALVMLGSVLLAVGAMDSGWKIRNMVELDELKTQKIELLESYNQQVALLEELTSSINSIEASVTSKASVARGLISFLVGIILLNCGFGLMNSKTSNNKGRIEA